MSLLEEQLGDYLPVAPVTVWRRCAVIWALPLLVLPNEL